MFLREDESFDHAQDRYVGQSPIAYALNDRTSGTSTAS